VPGDPHVDDGAALERDNDERVQRLEVHSDDRQEIAAHTCEAWF
jgi:hypothetical protein